MLSAYALSETKLNSTAVNYISRCVLCSMMRSALYERCLRCHRTIIVVVFLSSISFLINVSQWCNSDNGFSPEVMSLQRRKSTSQNRLITSYDPYISKRLDDLVRRQATAADADLIMLIKDLIDEPSKHMIKMSIHPVRNTPQSKEIDNILKRKVRR